MDTGLVWNQVRELCNKSTASVVTPVKKRSLFSGLTACHVMFVWQQIESYAFWECVFYFIPRAV